jgi:hypothetical protein
MSRTVVRTLDTLPPGMTVDSTPRMLEDECIIPRPDRKPLAVKAATDCRDCHGRAMVTEIVTVAGEDPVRNERPCSCVWRAVQSFERQEMMGSAAPEGVKAASVQPGAVALERARGRVARIRSELAAAEATLADAERAREQKMAPFLARIAEAEGAAVHAETHYAGCTLAVEDCRRLADQAQEALLQAQDTMKTALEAYEQATNLAESAQKRLDPLERAINEAREAARLAANTGGERHKIDLAHTRIDQMRTRLKYAEDNAAKLEPTAEATP